MIDPTLALANRVGDEFIGIENIVFGDEQQGNTGTYGFVLKNASTKHRTYASERRIPQEDIVFQWTFPDGSTANGQEPEHSYSISGHDLVVTVEAYWIDYPEVRDEMTAYVDVVADLAVESPVPEPPLVGGKICFNQITEIKIKFLPDTIPAPSMTADSRYKIVDVTTQRAKPARAAITNNHLNNLLLDPNQFYLINTEFGLDFLQVSIDYWRDNTPTGATDQSKDLHSDGPGYWINRYILTFYEFEGIQADTTHDQSGVGVTWPNWYFYYRQVSIADRGCEYLASGSKTSIGDDPDYPPYVGKLDNPKLHYKIENVFSNEIIMNRCGNDPELWGIDCFAWSSRHEIKHSSSLKTWWGISGYPETTSDLNLLDFDRDIVSDSFEPGMSRRNGGPFSNYQMYTWSYPTLDLGIQSQLTDVEVNAEMGAEDWAVGSATNQDYAFPGSLWKN